jgi:SRSO17 transposase
MGLTKSGDVASRFSAYIDGLASVIGHAGRAKPLRDYCTGLMMPCDRKSVEPMAAMTAPERTAAGVVAFCRPRRLVGSASVGQDS